MDFSPQELFNRNRWENRYALCANSTDRSEAIEDVCIHFTSQPVKREWFFEQRNGSARLMASLTERLSETAPTWARAVAPVAEWVAQALLNFDTKLGSAGITGPTRLTHRHRSEGRGKIWELRMNPLPRKSRNCEVCGAEGIKNRYYSACAVEASRENMRRVALIGHTKLRTKKTKVRILKVLSDHAVADTWWDPSSLPSWLTEEYYAKTIQPSLQAIKVKVVADAIQVSKPYATLIRAGRRRPHPRHWQSLAKLVGVGEFNTL